MGKGRIISAQGEGLYTLEILEDRTRADANRTLAVDRVADIDTRIPELETDLGEAQAEVDAAAAAQDQAIADYQAALADDTMDTEMARQAMVDAGAAIIEAAGKRDAILGNIRALKAERLSLQSRINLIDALPPLRQISAWCADYTEDLSGDVATAEVPGEVGKVIIKPGYSDSAAWSASADGAIQPALSGTPAGVFYNLAMMPGWQKWRPTFRIATISNINNDLCDITLVAAKSSQQNLDVNMASAYDGVPIMYMDCNGGAFEDGDRVLVAFSGNTGQPVVVGFEQEPKQCIIPESRHYRQMTVNNIPASTIYNLTGEVGNRLFDVFSRAWVWNKIEGGTYTCGDKTYTTVTMEFAEREEFFSELKDNASFGRAPQYLDGRYNSSGHLARRSLSGSCLFEAQQSETNPFSYVSFSATANNTEYDNNAVTDGYSGQSGFSNDTVCAPGITQDLTSNITNSIEAVTQVQDVISNISIEMEMLHNISLSRAASGARHAYTWFNRWAPSRGYEVGNDIVSWSETYQLAETFQVILNGQVIHTESRSAAIATGVMPRPFSIAVDAHGFIYVYIRKLRDDDPGSGSVYLDEYYVVRVGKGSVEYVDPVPEHGVV